MSVFDIIVAVLLALSAIYGFSKGFVMQLCGLLAVFLGVYCAFKFSGLAASLIGKFISTNEGTIGIVSFIVTMVVVWILVIMLGKLLEKLLKISALAFINRLLGLVFAVAQTFFIIAAITYAFSCLPIANEGSVSEDIEKSKLYQPLKRTAEAAFPYINFSTFEKIK